MPIPDFFTRQLAAFRQRFHDFDAEAWDRQLEEDVRAGKLGRLGGNRIESFGRR